MSSLLVAVVVTSSGELVVGVRLQDGRAGILHELDAEEAESLAAALVQSAAIVRAGGLPDGWIAGDSSDEEIEAAIRRRRT